jgi:hypothetical protein
MKKGQLLIFFLIFSFFTQTTFAQKRDNEGLIKVNSSVGSLVFTVGAAHCIGDFTGPILGRFSFNTIRYEASMGFRHSFPNRFGYRVSIHHGLYESRDADQRLPSTTSNITMFTALGEFNVFQSSTTFRSSRMYVYGGGGWAYASIDFKGNLESSSIKNVTFKSLESTTIIPVGLGFDIWINSDFNFGVEGGFKYAFSDYMNGVRIAGSRNDILANISLTISHRLFGKEKERECRRGSCF